VSGATYLGFDYGERFIGVAVGRTPGNRCEALDTVHAAKGRPDWLHIGRLIQEWEAGHLVVGVPLNMDGTECDMTRLARRFGNQLHGRYNLPVHWAEERLTSSHVKHMLAAAGMPGTRHKSVLDKLAARLILQAFLDGQSGNTSVKDIL